MNMPVNFGLAKPLEQFSLASSIVPTCNDFVFNLNYPLFIQNMHSKAKTEVKARENHDDI